MADLRTTLDQLAELVAVATERPDGGCALAVVVAEVEELGGDTAPATSDVAPVLARRFAAAHRRLLDDGAALPADVTDRLGGLLAALTDPETAVRDSWNEWQRLRDADQPFVERLAAMDRLMVARRAACR